VLLVYVSIIWYWAILVNLGLHDFYGAVIAHADVTFQGIAINEHGILGFV
jgi:hypothetical protein